MRLFNCVRSRCWANGVRHQHQRRRIWRLAARRSAPTRCRTPGPNFISTDVRHQPYRTAAAAGSSFSTAGAASFGNNRICLSVRHVSSNVQFAATLPQMSVANPGGNNAQSWFQIRLAPVTNNTTGSDGAFTSNSLAGSVAVSAAGHWVNNGARCQCPAFGQIAGRRNAVRSKVVRRSTSPVVCCQWQHADAGQCGQFDLHRGMFDCPTPLPHRQLRDGPLTNVNASSNTAANSRRSSVRQTSR